MLVFRIGQNTPKSIQACDQESAYFYDIETGFVAIRDKGHTFFGEIQNISESLKCTLDPAIQKLLDQDLSYVNAWS